MRLREINSPGQLGIDNDLIDRFTDKGWEIVGEGQDQMVFGKPGSSMLLKVVGFGSLTRQAMIRKYIAFFRAHQSNPHFPRVGVDRTLKWKGRQYYAYTQERLLHLPGDEDVLMYLSDVISRAARDESPDYDRIPTGLTAEQVDGLVQAISSMFRAGLGIGGFDLANIYNLMQRKDGQLVIVDPYSSWDDELEEDITKESQVKRDPSVRYGSEGMALAEDKMGQINLDQNLARTPPKWQQFLRTLPPQLAQEFADERPNPNQEDIDFFTPLRLVSQQPVFVRVADLLRHPENQGSIGRSPDDVVAAVNQRWGMEIPSGQKYDPTPGRYQAYAQMRGATASPSVMVDGVILFGVGRFVSAALRGDDRMRVWSMTRGNALQAENFHDGKKPGRKGLSKRVGIPQKATLGQLEKIAKSSTGERRRMAQWQLNMRRGQARKNKD